MSKARAVWHRFLYVSFLFYTGMALISTMLGIVFLLSEGQLALLTLGFAGVALARFLYQYGDEHFQFGKIDQGFGQFDGSEWSPTADAVLNQRIERLHALEQELAGLREHVDDAKFDLWEVHEQRQKIRSLVESDPRLAEYTQKLEEPV